MKRKKKQKKTLHIARTRVQSHCKPWNELQWANNRHKDKPL